MNHWLILLTTLSPLLADISPYELSYNVSSDTAGYDGSNLVLRGNVTLDHDLGQMKARVAIINKEKSSLEPFSIHLENAVSILLESQKQLFSDEAFFDFQTMTGKVMGRECPIIFKDRELDLFCKTMDLSLNRKGKNVEISHLIAEQDVHIDYLRDFHIHCEKATYEKETLTATGKKPASLTHLGDWVHAKRIHLDLETNLLTLDSPEGELSSFFFPEDPKRKCQFASQLLTWNHQDHLLLLQKGVIIYDPLLGTLVGEDRFSLKQRETCGKWTVQTIKTTGKTVLSSNDGDSLTSYGTLKLERDALLITCESPPDQPLKYESKDHLLFANRARIEYSTQGFEPKPKTIYLDGNVQIFSHDLSRPLTKGLADHVIHHPQLMQTHLLADGDHTVLFWDEEKKLKLSAPEILITQEEGEEIVKGVGILRFTLTEEEKMRLDSLFPTQRN
ncbi:MAG: hypothetical protein QNJ27_05555 [Simkaniaceae bacterium]|nr:hypothetical protein [Simkaniaceae bacterium]